mgnify:CR=1 FL=1
MQEMRKHQKKISSGKKVNHWDYGRQGSQTTIQLQKLLNSEKSLIISYFELLHQNQRLINYFRRLRRDSSRESRFL